jgi:uncharacterized ParB-like nuclease family protein
MSYYPTQPDAGSAALRAFRQARWRADLQKLWARLTGQSGELLCYFEVHDLLLPEAGFTVVRQEIPVASIVGSVERCSDYTQGFLPLKDSDQGRWTRVKQAFASAKALPPIRVYRAGEVYFVVDGNHRVSVARQLGRTHIEAHVVQIQARVPLAIGDRPAELALKRSYARFLEATRLHELRPEADLWLAMPEGYAALQAEIEARRSSLAAAGHQEILVEEAAANWYDTIYLPVVEAIRRNISLARGDWTEASLYLALRAHHAALQEASGQEISLDLAVADLALQLNRPPTPARALTRLWRALVAPWRSQS